MFSETSSCTYPETSIIQRVRYESRPESFPFIYFLTKSQRAHPKWSLFYIAQLKVWQRKNRTPRKRVILFYIYIRSASYFIDLQRNYCTHLKVLDVLFPIKIFIRACPFVRPLCKVINKYRNLKHNFISEYLIDWLKKIKAALESWRMRNSHEVLVSMIQLPHKPERTTETWTSGREHISSAWWISGKTDFSVCNFKLPGHSPDLSSLEFFLSGYLNEGVYQNNTQNIAESRKLGVLDRKSQKPWSIVWRKGLRTVSNQEITTDKVVFEK